MLKIKNKFLGLFFILNFLIVSIIFGSFLIFFRGSNSKNIVKNIVKIEKKGQIIKNSKNPKNILNIDLETKTIISNGFFIEKNIILTTAHSVGKKNDVYEITTFFGEKIKAKLIKKDLEKDIAFLKTNKDFENFGKLKIKKDLKEGQIIISYYFSDSLEKLESNTGKILKINGENIISNLQLKKGNSGSPIFDKNLNVIGINKEFNILDKVSISQILKEF